MNSELNNLDVNEMIEYLISNIDEQIKYLHSEINRVHAILNVDYKHKNAVMRDYKQKLDDLREKRLLLHHYDEIKDRNDKRLVELLITDLYNTQLVIASTT